MPIKQICTQDYSLLTKVMFVRPGTCNQNNLLSHKTHTCWEALGDGDGVADALPAGGGADAVCHTPEASYILRAPSSKLLDSIPAQTYCQTVSHVRRANPPE